MITYPGLPGPVVTDHLSREDSRALYAAGTEFHIGRIDLVGNTGTYLDTPAHRFAGGYDLAGLPLKAVAGLDSIVVEAGEGAIGVEAVAGRDLAGKAVLFRTGWDRHWGSEAYGGPGHPFLTAALAELLVAGGAVLAGIDSVNIDDIAEGARPVHTILLGAKIPIVEHLCRLETLPAEGFEFFAVPVKVAGLGTFPVRAFAVW
jgi:kynurenine formamidase